MSNFQDPEVQCPGCSDSNAWFAEFCTSCGTSLAGVTLQGGGTPVVQGDVGQPGNTEIQCPSCRAMNGLSDRFCTSCGTSLSGMALQGGYAPAVQGEEIPSGNTQLSANIPPQSTVLCTSCGTAVDSSVRFCTRCGTPVGPGVTQQRSQGGITCPYCSSNSPPIFKKTFTGLTWVVLIVLLILDFLLAPLALFVREEQRVCSACGISLG